MCAGCRGSTAVEFFVHVFSAGDVRRGRDRSAGRGPVRGGLDEHRAQLNGCLEGLTEEQVRRSLVPSRTTLLGLVKRATFVEKVLVRRSHHRPLTC